MNEAVEGAVAVLVHDGVDGLDGALVGKVHRGGVVKRRQTYDVRQIGAGGDARLKCCGVLVRWDDLKFQLQALLCKQGFQLLPDRVVLALVEFDVLVRVVGHKHRQTPGAVPGGCGAGSRGGRCAAAGGHGKRKRRRKE